MGRGTLDMRCSVVASSRVDGPKSLTVRLGMEGPPDIAIGQPWPADRGFTEEQSLPASAYYLALVTKPRDVEWKRFAGPVVPRLIAVADQHFRPVEGSNMQRTLTSLFRFVASGQPEQSQQVVRWLYAVWQTNAIPLIRKWQPAFPPDNRLALLSGDLTDREVGAVAIAESKKADASQRPYLTLLGALWGADAGFVPFLDSCTDPKARPNLDLLSSMLDDPSFPVVPLKQAIDLARRAGTMAGVVMRLARFEGKLSDEDRKDLFHLTSSMQKPEDRREVYRKMCRDLPLDLTTSFPEGLQPPYKSDGSIPQESAYRAMWQRYLGLPVDQPPP